MMEHPATKNLSDAQLIMQHVINSNNVQGTSYNSISKFGYHPSVLGAATISSEQQELVFLRINRQGVKLF
jgi:hypothetical protein